MKNSRVLALSLLLILGFLGCEKKAVLPEIVDCGTLPLEGTWRLDAYQKLSEGTLETDPDPKGRGVVLTFTEEGKTVRFEGHTVANTVSGTYQKGDSCRLEQGTFGGTKVGEPTEFSSRAWVGMNGAERYGRTTNQLFIYFNEGSDVMIFDRQP
jgi:hypothetical protein